MQSPRYFHSHTVSTKKMYIDHACISSFPPLLCRISWTKFIILQPNPRLRSLCRPKQSTHLSHFSYLWALYRMLLCYIAKYFHSSDRHWCMQKRHYITILWTWTLMLYHVCRGRMISTGTAYAGCHARKKGESIDYYLQ